MEELMVTIDDDNKIKVYLVDQFGDIIQELDASKFQVHLN
jgi:hypothetical protein